MKVIKLHAVAGADCAKINFIRAVAIGGKNSFEKTS